MMMDTMTVGDWIAVASLLLAIQATVVGSAVWIVRATGRAMAAGPEAVHDHERDCAHFEPNTSVQIQALRDHA